MNLSRFALLLANNLFIFIQFPYYCYQFHSFDFFLCFHSFNWHRANMTSIWSDIILDPLIYFTSLYMCFFLSRCGFPISLQVPTKFQVSLCIFLSFWYFISFFQAMFMQISVDFIHCSSIYNEFLVSVSFLGIRVNSMYIFVPTFVLGLIFSCSILSSMSSSLYLSIVFLS